MDSDTRARAALEIIDLVRDRLNSGEAIDDDHILQENAHLLPELEIQLRALRRIRRSDSNGNSRGRPAKPSDDDIDHNEIRRFLERNLSQYTIGECVAHGGQGVVFRAVQARTHRDVAIKMLIDGAFASKRSRDRFLREIELAGRLTHPFIVTVYESGIIEDRPYCVMEFVDGEPIDDFVILENLSIDSLLRLFAAICSALSHAHQRGVIHRDLKPANILIDTNGDPRVLDFGLARFLVDSPEERISLSLPGQVVGTLPYQSPEQLTEESKLIDVRSDIYSLGVIFFQLLTGSFPYPVTGSYDAIRTSILSEQPISLRKINRDAGIDIDADIEAILRKTLEKDASSRYQSVEALEDDIHRYLAGEPVQARGDTRFYVLRKTMRRYRIQLAVVAAILVITTTGAITSTMLWIQARHAKIRANESASFAHRTLSHVVTEVDSEVARMAGGQAVRNSIYQTLSSDVADLATVLGDGLDSAILRARVAINEGDVAVRNGDRANAVTHFQKAAQFVERNDEIDEQAKAVRIEALTRLGHVAGDPWPALDEAVQRCRGHIEGAADRGRFLNLLAGAYVECARRSSLSGDDNSAVHRADDAIALLVHGDTDSAHYLGLLREVANAHQWAASARLELGDCDAVEKHILAGLNLLDQIISVRPRDVIARQDRARARHRMYDLLKGQGRIIEAKPYLDQAIDEGELLREFDPTEAEGTRDLISAYGRRMTSEVLENPASARITFERIQKIFGNMTRSLVEDERIRELRAGFTMLEGDYAEQTGNREAAIAAYFRAGAIYQELDSGGFNNMKSKNNLAYCLWKTSISLQEDNQLEAALELATRSLEIRTELLSQNGENVDRQLDAIGAQFMVARITRYLDGPHRLNDALASFSRIRDDLKRLEADPTGRCHLDRIQPWLKAAQTNIRQITKLLAG